LSVKIGERRKFQFCSRHCKCLTEFRQTVKKIFDRWDYEWSKFQICHKIFPKMGVFKPYILHFWIKNFWTGKDFFDIFAYCFFLLSISCHDAADLKRLESTYNVTKCTSMFITQNKALRNQYLSTKAVFITFLIIFFNLRHLLKYPRPTSVICSSRCRPILGPLLSGFASRRVTVYSFSSGVIQCFKLTVQRCLCRWRQRTCSNLIDLHSDKTPSTVLPQYLLT